MPRALYRKYRSRKLSEVVGQEHVTSTLANALKNGRISHAYLFTGPRGVGKTSVARILAHEINNLPYTDDAMHLDIIEIDAASNRRIDEIRDLREKVFTAPAEAKYKVYIIDEVHMLTREAFNALLKTLEEPPAHVVFILATTDAHKLPETIISRTQRFSFKPVSNEKVIAHLRSIAKSEKLQVEDEALTLLAEHGEGSFRDSISLLDQASSHSDKLTADAVRALLGVPEQDRLEDLYEQVAAGNGAVLMKSLAKLYSDGYEPVIIAKEFSSLLRDKLLAGATDFDILSLLDRLLEMPAATDPARLLEILLLQAQPTISAPQAAVSAKPSEMPRTSKAIKEKKPAALTDQSRSSPRPSPAGKLDLSMWPAVLSTLKQRHNTLYGVIRMAEPVFVDDQHLQLQFAFAFHQKRINEAANRQILTSIIKEVTGQTVLIECLHNKQASPPKLPAPNSTSGKADPSLSTISNIFGGGELLES